MEAVIDYEDGMTPIPDELQEPSIRPLCPGCSKEIVWIDEAHPYCACGCPLYFPIPTSEHI